MQVDPDSGANKVTGYDLTLQGVEAPITVPAKGLVPVVFTMKEMGIDYPVVYQGFSDQSQLQDPKSEL